MLSSNAFKRLAVRNQTTELNIKREYVQNLFLSYFYQKPWAREIFFKGGTALKIVYQSSRFSEDLDFSSTITNKKLIEEMVVDVLKDIKKTNLKARLIESKKTSGGYLAIIEFMLPLVIKIQLEISFREKNIQGEVVTVVNDFVPTYSLISLERDELVRQKIKALMERRKPRDFYDLYFILRANLLSVNERKVLVKILPMIEESKIYFERELGLFLPKNQWMIIKDFKKVLKREIGRYV
jgi:predicted nucleotidyltransferase component of viral defense system